MLMVLPNGVRDNVAPVNKLIGSGPDWGAAVDE
jgi:hypothetical protein